MKGKIIKTGIILFLLIKALSSLYSQNNYIVQTKGTEFAFGFMEQYNFSNAIGTERYDVFVSADQATTGVLSIPGAGYQTSFSVAPNVTTIISVPYSTAEHLTTEVVENKGIYVVTEDTVSVYAINFMKYTADATLVFPINALGTEYRVTGYEGLNDYLFPTLLIVATENNTYIDITPSIQTMGGHMPGVTYSILLNRGQSYQIKAKNNYEEFTGTVIKASASSGPCRPFAVFTGNMCVNIPSGCTACDILYEQEQPVQAWGNEYMIAPIKNTSHYTYKFVVNENNTSVMLNGTSLGIFQAGQSYEANYVASPVLLKSNKPIFVSQFMEGITCTGWGDPSQIMINDINQKIQRITFSTVSSTVITNHVVSVIIKSSHIPQLRLDGIPVLSANFNVFTPNSQYSYAQLTLPTGSHTLEADSGFYAYLYGTGSAESYAYALGSFKKVTTIPTTYVYCTNSMVTLVPSTVLNNDSWSTMSDPGNIISTSSTLSIVPNTSESYIYSGYNLQNGCFEQYYFYVEIPVDPVLQITTSEDTVCMYSQTQLNVNPIPYSPIYTYRWFPSYGLSDSTISNPVAVPPFSMWYYCEVSTPSGCAHSIDSVYVVVKNGSLSNISVMADPDSYCETGTSQIEVSAEKIVISDDFNNATPGGMWSATSGAVLSNSCGSVSGNSLLFNGTGTRYAKTNPVNVSSGGRVYFYLKISNGNSPCGSAEAGEDVILEYSVNGGVTFSGIQLYTVSDYPNLSFVSTTIPVPAQTNSTIFRWRQVSYSGIQNDDVWLIDNVYIGVQSNTGLSINWSPGTGLSSTNSFNITASPLNTTEYNYVIFDNNYGCVYHDSVLIDVGHNFLLSTTPDDTLCQLSGIQLHSIPSSPGNYTYFWSPSTVLDYNNIQNPVATPDITTQFYVTVTSSQGCVANDSVNINIPQLFDFSIVVDPDSVCSGTPVQIETDISKCCQLTTSTCSATTSANIGSGTTINTNNSIYHGSTLNARSQLFFTKAELNAIGMVGPTTISSIGFSISSISGSNIYQQFKIDIGCTGQLINGTFNQNLINVFTPKNILLTTGINYYPLDYNYIWDGVSNLVIDVCFNNNVASSNSGVYVTNSTSGYYITDYNTSACNSFSGTVNTIRPNTYFKFCPVIQNNQFIYSWTPSSTINFDTVSNPIATPLLPTWYYVDVYDPTINCHITDSVWVQAGHNFETYLNDSINSCTTSGVMLSATTSLPGIYSYQWSPTSFLSNSAISNPVATPLSTTEYIVTITSSEGCSKTDTVTVGVSVPYLYTFSALPELDTICYPDSIQITTSLYGGCGLNSNPCMGSSTTHMVGSGNACSAMNSITPFRGTYTSSKSQYLYTKSELNAVGIYGPTTIRKIGFNLFSVSSPTTYNNFTIKIKCTTTNVLNSVFETGTMTVFYPKTITLTTGVNMFVLDTAYTWDGVSNIIIELCYNNPTTGANSVIYYNTTSYVSSIYTYGSSVCNVTTGSNSLNKPHVYIDYCEAITTYNLQYSWIPSIGLSSDTIANPVVEELLSITYYVQAIDTLTGCVMRDSVEILSANPLTLNIGNDTTICSNDRIFLTAQPGFNGYLWSNNSTGQSIIVSQPGTYWVQVHDFCSVQTDSITITMVDPHPIVNLGPDTTLCFGDTLLLNGYNQEFLSYAWNNGSDDSAIFVTDPGEYILVANNLCGVGRDSVNVTVDYPSSLNLVSDTIICNANTLVIEADTGFTYYEWNTGEHSSAIIADSNGLFIVNAINQCGSDADSIIVSFAENPVADLGPDFKLCNGDSIVITVADPEIEFYLWNTGSTNDYLNVLTGGGYSVTVTNFCGVDTDSINIEQVELPQINIISDTSICENTILQIDVSFSGNEFYLWSDGQTGSNATFSDSGLYILTTGNICDTLTGSFNLDIILLPVALLPNDTNLCDGDSLVINAYQQQNNSYIWNGIPATSEIVISNEGLFSLVTSNVCGLDSDSVYVAFIQMPVIILQSDSVLCEGTSIVLDPVAQNVNEYLWQDGSADSIYIVTSPGIYILEGSNNCGISIDSVNIQGILLPSVSLLPQQYLCLDDTITLDAYSQQNDYYIWSTGDSSSAIDIIREGMYSVTVSNICGSVADTSIITYIKNPEISLPGDTVVCNGQSILLDPVQENVSEYLWNNGGSDSSIYVTSGGTVWVTGSNECGSETDTIIISQVFQPELVLVNDTIICKGDSFSVSVYPDYYTYLWNNGSVENEITVNSSGHYSLLVTGPCGIDSAGFSVTDEINYPVKPFGEDTTSCSETILLDAFNTGCTYLWSTGDSTQQIIINQEGQYSVIVGRYYCFISDTIDVEFKNVSIYIDSLIKTCNSLVTLDPVIAGATGYNWSTGDSTSTLAVNQSGQYYITAYNQYCSANKEINVIILSDGKELFPNIFTPNGDNFNEIFKPEISFVQEYNIEIFNRWGQLMYQTTNPDEGWDGRYEGDECTPGVYYYLVRYKSMCSNEEKVVKSFFILRK